MVCRIGVRALVLIGVMVVLSSGRGWIIRSSVGGSMRTGSGNDLVLAGDWV